MSGNPTVASGGRAGPRRLRRAALLRPPRHRQFQDFPRPGRSRRRIDFGASRRQCRRHGRRLCQGDRRTHAGQRAFRPGAHQCADRHRRSREKPDAAPGAGGRCPQWSGEEQFLYRAGRNGACRRRGVGAAAYAGLGARRHAARRHPRAARPADRGLEHAARRAARAARLESAAARIAAGARPAASRSARRRAPRRCIGARAASAHPRRPRRGDLRCRAGFGCARRQHRRAVGDFGVRPRTVFGKSLVGRHQRRLFVAGRRRADFRERFHPGVRRQPDAVDHQEGQADRARRRGGAGRCRRAETRLSDAGAACGAWRCQGDGAGVAGGTRQAGKRQSRPSQQRHARAHPRRRQSSLPASG